MAKGTLEVGGTAEGGKMASLEVEQSATGGVAGALKVDNDDVDKQAIVVEASNTTVDVADITADAVTTAKVIDITADALTSGSALYIDSDSASTTARSLVTVIQNHASAVAATGVTVQSDGGRGIFVDSNLAAGLPSLEIDSEHTTTNTAIINSDALTTGTAIQVNADALTTGAALFIDSDSASTSARSLAKIIQNNASAVAATALTVQSDGGRGLFIDSNLAAGLPSLEIDSEHTTANTVIINGDALTTGSLMQLNADALTTGSVIDIDSNSSTTGTRNVVSIVQNHASATGATTLYVQNDSTGAAINSTGNVTVTGKVKIRQGQAFISTFHHSWVMGG